MAPRRNLTMSLLQSPLTRRDAATATDESRKVVGIIIICMLVGIIFIGMLITFWVARGFRNRTANTTTTTRDTYTTRRTLRNRHRWGISHLTGNTNGSGDVESAPPLYQQRCSTSERLPQPALTAPEPIALVSRSKTYPESPCVSELCLAGRPAADTMYYFGGM